MNKVLVLIFFLSTSVLASDWNIDLETGPLGVNWEASEPEIINILGEPNGHFIVSKHKKLLYYGKRTTLFLTRGKLKEIMYAEYDSTALYNTPISLNANFDRAEITINGKKVLGESFSNLAKSLEMDLGVPAYQAEIATDTADLLLSFSSSEWSGKKVYQLTKFRVKYPL